jgi:5'-nucleotidase
MIGIIRLFGFFCFCSLTCHPLVSWARPTPTLVDPIQITFILTNDLHGHLDAHSPKLGLYSGGMAALASYVNHLRTLPLYQSGQAGLVVLDSGDQFQGTLLSNYDEGHSMFKAMNEVGYDAVVPGNHDYDFGPLGWLYDRVTAGETSENPLEVIESLAKSARFPLLSANTYLKDSIKTQVGRHSVELNSSCEPAHASPAEPLDFILAQRPSFLSPYQIIEKAGVKIALIGLDNKNTASTTTSENVESLCFRDELETYLEVRRTLEGRADLFVLLIHQGDSSNSKTASELTQRINSTLPRGVDLVAAGHTHAIHLVDVDGVPVIQDGAEARAFGRVDLQVDPLTRTVIRSKTRAFAGQALDHDRCKGSPQNLNSFICANYPVPLVPHPEVVKIVETLKLDIAPLAKRVVAQTQRPLTRSRTEESSLSNALTDALRSATQSDVSLMNTGGIRTDLPAGAILYEQFFAVLPFANRVAVIQELPWNILKSLLLKSAQTCGKYGALLFSGLKVEFSRNCKTGSDLDLEARLIQVKTIQGEVLLDQQKGIETNVDRTFKVATLDFLASGGSGYEEFKGSKVTEVLGIAREVIADEWIKNQTLLTGDLDQRFLNLRL